MQERYVVIVDGIVVNAIIWDGETPYEPGDGATLLRSDVLNIGDAAP